MKNLLCAILVVSYFNSSLVYADAADDFARQMDEAAAKYRNDIESLVRLERTEISPSHVKEGLVNAFALTQNAMVQHFHGIDEDIIKLNSDSEVLANTVTDMISASQDVSLENYDKIIKSSTAASLLIQSAELLLADVSARASVLEKLANGKEGICEKIRNTIEPPVLSLESAGSIMSRTEKSPFLGVDPNDFYAQSPLARGYALAAGSTTFVLAVYAYASINNVSIYKAITTLFSLSADNSGILLNGSGPGAIILLAVVCVAFIIGSQKVMHENAVARDKRDKALSRLKKAIEDAQEYYINNRITAPELKSLALDNCREEMKEVKANGKPGMVFTKNKTWNESIAGVKSTVKSLDSYIENMSLTKIQVALLSDQAKNLLSDKINSQIISDHLTQTIDQERLTYGWSIYNDSVKPIWGRFSTYASSVGENCFELWLAKDSSIAELDEARSLVLGTVSGVKADSSSLISQLTAAVQITKSNINSRVGRCLSF